MIFANGQDQRSKVERRWSRVRDRIQTEIISIQTGDSFNELIAIENCFKDKKIYEEAYRGGDKS